MSDDDQRQAAERQLAYRLAAQANDREKLSALGSVTSALGSAASSVAVAVAAVVAALAALATFGG